MRAVVAGQYWANDNLRDQLEALDEAFRFPEGLSRDNIADEALHAVYQANLPHIKEALASMGNIPDYGTSLTTIVEFLSEIVERQVIPVTV